MNYRYHTFVMHNVIKMNNISRNVFAFDNLIPFVKDKIRISCMFVNTNISCKMTHFVWRIRYYPKIYFVKQAPRWDSHT